MAEVGSWLTLNKTEGSGNDSVICTAVLHTGRNSRSINLAFAAKDAQFNTLKQIRTVTQAAHPEFITSENDSSDITAYFTPVGTQGNFYSLTGYSNSRGIKIMYVDCSHANNRNLLIIGRNSDGTAGGDIYYVNEQQSHLGQTIVGDPGRSEKYKFSIPIQVEENPLIDNPITFTFSIVSIDSSECYANVTIILGSKEASLEVEEGPFSDLPAKGTGRLSIEVTSTINWKIEKQIPVSM